MVMSQSMSEKKMTTNPLWVSCNVNHDSLIPKYQTDDSAGCDLHAVEDVEIKPGSRALVGTGVKLEIPTGFCGQVCPRSGLAIKYGVTVLNAPGIIDSDYRGEIKVILYNTSQETFYVKRGDRIAQLLFVPFYQGVFRKSESLESSQRGEGGFGSTGV